MLRPHRALLLLTLACDAQPHEAPPPPRVIEPPAPQPEPEPPPPPPPPAIAPGSDAPPDKPTTRAESEAAAPHWAKGGLDEIPPAELHALYEKLGEPVDAGAIAGALLICSVDVGGPTDNPGLFDLPDLTTVLTFGKNPRVELRGSEDTSGMYIASAQATLTPGDSIRATVIDRDFLRDRTIGSVRGTYKGTLPWKGKAGRATVECRALVGPKLDAALTERLAGCDQALTEVAPRVAFQPELEDLGFLDSGLTWARTALRRPAALVGWADPRVQRRLEWMRRIEQPFVAAAKQFLAETLAKTPPATALVPIVPMQLRGRVEQWTCDPDDVKRAVRSAGRFRRSYAKERGGCVLRLRIENTGAREFVVDSFMTEIEGIATPRLVLENGDMIPLAGLAIEGHRPDSGDHTLAPGETGIVVAVPARDQVATGAAPPILVLTGAVDSDVRVWLRVP